MQTCECGVKCSNKFNLHRHQLTRVHELNMQCGEKLVYQDGTYDCSLCDYTTTRKDTFRKHLLSDRHQAVKQSVPKAAASSSHPVMLLEVVEMLLKHQTSQQAEILKTFSDRILANPTTLSLSAAAAAAVPLQSVTLQNSQITTNNITNQSFNLQFFLNEECKNAMNFSDFIQTLSVTLEDIKHLGEVGYTQGMSKILTRALRETKLRPMHCTDAKRETMYVKENDEWHRDLDCEESKRLIQKITQKNYKALAEWRSTLPEQLVHDTEDYETWYSMSRSMCNTDPAAIKKLIRHMANITSIEKS